MEKETSLSEKIAKKEKWAYGDFVFVTDVREAVLRLEERVKKYVITEKDIIEIFGPKLI